MKKLFISALLVLIGYTGFSQQNLIMMNIKVYDPKGALNNNIDRTPAGFSFSYWRDTPTRFAFGGEMGISMYSNDNYDFVSVTGDVLEINEEDCFWTIHGGARYYLMETQAIKPYAEARVGITTFFSSRISIVETNEFDDSFEFHGTAWNTALGGGTLINFNQLFNGEPGLFVLDLGFNYHKGTRATYRNFEMVDGPINSLNDGTFRSLTDYIDYKIGLGMRF